MDSAELVKQCRKYKSIALDTFSCHLQRQTHFLLERAGSWSFLNEARRTIKMVNLALAKHGIKIRTYTGHQGTEEVVKQLGLKNSPDILDFSTHGYYFPKLHIDEFNLASLHSENQLMLDINMNPWSGTGLVLSGANLSWRDRKWLVGVDDGILTSYEVTQLCLKSTTLVFMGACESGLGMLDEFGQVFSLHRAFKMAGVKYVVMTLWKVLDVNAADFKILFYQNLIDKKNIPDAFKAAQDIMKNKYRDEPYKWAGFVLVK
jgi:CHAT domain-containing protein